MKCSGTTPRCQNCDAAGRTCVYEQSRRDRLDEYTFLNLQALLCLLILRKVIQLNHTLATLLWDMNKHLDDESRQKIQDVLDIVCSPVVKNTSLA